MSSCEVISVFGTLIETLPSPSSRKSYGKFLALFENFICDAPLGFKDLTPKLSNDFAVWLIDSGYSQTYVTRLGQNFKSLYNAAAKEGWCIKRKDLFNWVTSRKGKARDVGSQDLTEVILSVNNRKFSSDSIHSRYRNYLNLSILLGGVPLDRIAKLNADSLSDGRLILKGRQGEMRSFLATKKISQLILDIQTNKDVINSPSAPAASVNTLADALLLPIEERIYSINDESLSETTESILRSIGIKSNVIRHYLYQTSASSSLTIIDDDMPVGEIELDHVTSAVEDFLFGTRKRWYALRMFVPYDEIVSLMKDAEAIMETTSEEPFSIYYPMGEIIRKVGGKIRKTISPVLRNILFVSAQKTLVEHLSGLLKGKASFIRTYPDDTASFSIIPDKEMLRFQELMSVDGEFRAVKDGKDFHSGMQLDVTGDIFTGHKAIVIRKEKDGRYLVNVLGSNFRVITAKISKTFLR